ncbi:hypothetical protein M513_01001 [Trichuris suis]|uniref:DDE-1 domain-containing protein n=1 Tax=Trichuris suis TaxID=68888 RepID=A0A085MLZ2_9BILA|nr:hypothetical protein M513_01001 [Trichuris suis]
MVFQFSKLFLVGLKESNGNIGCVQEKKTFIKREFCNNFKEPKRHLDEEGFDRCFIYSADETELNWKLVPKELLVSRKEECTPGNRASRERDSLTVCARSNDRHSIPLLFIRKGKNRKSFRKSRNLSCAQRSDQCVDERWDL